METLQDYKKLVKTSKFVGTQPVTFNNKTFNNKTKYFLTNKLDGKRALLYFNNFKAYLITSKLEFTLFKIKVNADLNDTLLDCEYFQNKVFVFDILFFKTKDLRDFNLTTRLNYLSMFNDIYKHKKIKMKKYLHSNICSDFKLLNDTKKYAKNIIDGVIFTPDCNYYQTPLKWKPTELLSIDFKIKKLPNDHLALLTHSGTIFTPKEKKYKNIGTVHAPGNTYKDNEVVEFVFKNNKFVPIRSRPDKINSNYITVIMSNFNTIKNPPKILELLKCN